MLVEFYGVVQLPAFWSGKWIKERQWKKVDCTFWRISGHQDI